MDKSKFLRKDHKTYKPKYKPYCNVIVVEQITFKNYFKRNLQGS